MRSLITTKPIELVDTSKPRGEQLVRVAPGTYNLTRIKPPKGHGWAGKLRYWFIIPGTAIGTSEGHVWELVDYITSGTRISYSR